MLLIKLSCAGVPEQLHLSVTALCAGAFDVDNGYNRSEVHLPSGRPQAVAKVEFLPTDHHNGAEHPGNDARLHVRPGWQVAFPENRDPADQGAETGRS